MSEACVTTAAAAVHYFDHGKNSWVPRAQGAARVGLYNDASKNSYRFVAQSAANEFILNTYFFAEMKYQKVTEVWHQFQDKQNVMWGFNFARKEEAAAFSTAVEQAVVKLKQPAGPAAPPAPPAAPPAPAPPSAPPAPPGPPAAPPGPGPAAPKAAPPSGGGGGGGGGERNALLGQIRGGMKLKKATTVDKGKPVGAGGVQGEKKESDSGGGGGGGGGAPAPVGGGGGGLMAELLARQKKKTSGPSSPAMPRKEPQAPSFKAPPPKKAVPASPKSSPKAEKLSMEGGEDLKAVLADFKKELMEEVRQELDRVKKEILDALGK